MTIQVTEGMPYPHCCICGGRDAYIPKIGIAMSMAGDDYTFCQLCAESISLSQFFEALFRSHGYDWPPRLKDKG